MWRGQGRNGIYKPRFRGNVQAGNTDVGVSHCYLGLFEARRPNEIITSMNKRRDSKTALGPSNVTRSGAGEGCVCRERYTQHRNKEGRRATVAEKGAGLCYPRR